MFACISHAPQVLHPWLHRCCLLLFAARNLLASPFFAAFLLCFSFGAFESRWLFVFLTPRRCYIPGFVVVACCLHAVVCCSRRRSSPRFCSAFLLALAFLARVQSLLMPLILLVKKKASTSSASVASTRVLVASALPLFLLFPLFLRPQHFSFSFCKEKNENTSALSHLVDEVRGGGETGCRRHDTKQYVANTQHLHGGVASVQHGCDAAVVQDGREIDHAAAESHSDNAFA